MMRIKNIVYVLLFFSILFFLRFSNQKQEIMPCCGIAVLLENESKSFISIDEIANIINTIVDSVIGVPIKNIPINEIESSIENHALIEEAEVFILPNGELNIKCVQKKPIIRVQNIRSEEFYLGVDGKAFPLSGNYTQNVLVANGYINDSTDLVNLTKLSSYIDKNPFWKSQIIQLYLNQNKEFELIPRVGNHVVLFGDLDGMESKFEKLMLFYQKGVKQIGWNRYTLINLKYKNQLVCVK